MTERKIDHVQIKLSRTTISLPWESRQELLREFRHLDSMADVRKAFEDVGTSQPVVLTQAQKASLVEVIDFWGNQARGGLPGLPEGIHELRNALHDDLRDASVEQGD